MLTQGTRLGPYEILSPAGAGGMGEVYRARDTRLDRTVAVKVLGASLGANPEALQRFEREARAVSALNHANICSLYDVGTEKGTPYLVMEYVEGESLAERLTRGPLPVKDASAVAIQMGDALDQAHRRGIVHRDLKPGNVMLAGARGSTAVKLLDFGLAKVAGAQTSTPDPGRTVTQGLTAEGSLVGTFQYMAPEQLEGKDADARSDIFAFGCVLYEMITGRRAFEGKSQASLISAIMASDPPPISSLQPMSPPALDRVVRQCLAKDPEDRWQTARDLVRELRWISQSDSQMGAAPAIAARRRRRLGAASILAAVFAVAFLALAAVHFLQKPPQEHVIRFLVPPPDKYTFVAADLASLSPDGTRLVFTAVAADRRVLFMRSLDSPTAKPLSGDESGYAPFWSPDGRYVVTYREGKLRKIDLEGGPPVTICDSTGFTGGTWSQDGVIVFGAGGRPLQRVSAAGGTPAPLTKLDTARGEGGHLWPWFLPDGRHFIFTVTSPKADVGGVYAGSLDSPQAIKRILGEQTNAQYAAPGFLLFLRGDVLMAQPFDSRRLELTGDAFPVGEQAYSFGYTIGGAFSTGGGVLAYRTSNTASSQLVWFDRKGLRGSSVGVPADFSNPTFSPDGRTLAVGLRNPATRTRDIWLGDLARGAPSRLTFDPADDTNPSWSPDGQHIAFSSNRKGPHDIYQTAAAGTGQEEVLLQSPDDKNVLHWTRDGKYILFNQGTSARRSLWVLPLFGDRKPFEIVKGPGSQNECQVSPDGRWIAYTSSETGRGEIYVQNFPSPGGKWQVSTGGGGDPQWSRDGKELFYMQGNTLMEVAVKTGGERFERDLPKPLFEAPFVSTGRNRYAVSPDGQRFLTLLRTDTGSSPPIAVVVNWLAGVKR